MTIVNSNVLNNASTAYAEMFDEVFQGTPIETQNFVKYTTQVSEVGSAYEWNILEGFPYLKEALGPFEVTSLLASINRIETKEFYDRVTVSHVDAETKINQVTSRIKNFIAAQPGSINKLVFDKLITGNSVDGHDGVSFFNSAHINADGSTTQSNYTTNTLSLDNYKTACISMRNFTDTTGKPLYIKPRQLFVGPSLFFIARDILKAEMRVASVNNSGGESGTRVAAASIPNIAVTMDGVEIIEEPLLTGTYAYHWFLFGSTDGGNQKPMILNTVKALTPEDNVNELQTSQYYTFGVRGMFGVGFGLWQTAYGSFATS